MSNYYDRLTLLINEVKSKVLPAMQFYLTGFNKKTSIFRVCGKHFHIALINFNNNDTLQIFDYGTNDMYYLDNLSDKEFFSIHQNNVSILRAIIKEAKDLKEQYIEIDNLIDECEKVSIKVATRTILIEKHNR